MTLTLDTSGIVAVANAADPQHEAARTAFEEDRGPHVVPAGILAEAAYVLEARVGPESLTALLSDLDARRLLLDCGEDDLGRIRELAVRYADLPLGFSDAAVIACAERRDSTILTLDRRDFDVVAGELPLRIAP